MSSPKKHPKEEPTFHLLPWDPREPRDCMRTSHVPYRSVSTSVTLYLLTLVGASVAQDATVPWSEASLCTYYYQHTDHYHQSIIRGINSATTANNPDSAQDGRKLAAHFLPCVPANGRQGSHWRHDEPRRRKHIGRCSHPKPVCVTERRTEAHQGDRWLCLFVWG